MKRVSLVQIGFGTVGGALVEQVLDNQDRWRETQQLDIQIVAVAGREGAWTADPGDALPANRLREVVERRRSGLQSTLPSGSIQDALQRHFGRGPLIVLDASSGDQVASLEATALDQGAGMVLSNKAPMALPMRDPRTSRLWSETSATGRLMYEATCGAGLPVISTLRSLLDAGDEILEITGTVSGTFGAIFSAVASGTPYSQAVRDARANGYTEPDPRDDLSGLDVARKGLILARTMGQDIDLEDIRIESLVPEALANGSADEFLAGLEGEDASIRERADAAANDNASLKYLVGWTPADGVTVGLRNVPQSTVLGALQGPENAVSFRTRRYNEYPCVISGPGAGAAVTAAGMVSDMLTLARRLAD